MEDGMAGGEGGMRGGREGEGTVAKEIYKGGFILTQLL
jgi:hypothetical protein